MVKTYYILDKKNKPIEVSEKEHKAWIELNEDKFNRKASSPDGGKLVHMYFVGEKEFGKKPVLFEVYDAFYGVEDEPITENTFEFPSIDSANERFESFFEISDVEEQEY